MGRQKKNKVIAETKEVVNEVVETTEIVEPIETKEEITIVKTIEDVKPLKATSTQILQGEKVGLKNKTTGKMVAMSVSKSYAQSMVKQYPHLEIL